MSKTDLSSIKSRKAAVQDVIRKTLKVDAGTQNTYDIIAASMGYAHFHAIKAASNLPFYELKANLGTAQKPFYITLEVGRWLQLVDAEATAREILADCQTFQTWWLYRDDENTHIKIETSPQPEQGLVYQIELTGKTMSDIEDSLDEVARRLDNVMGFDDNETGSFRFQRAGEENEHDTIAIDEGDEFVIFDSQGIQNSADYKDEIYDVWNNAADRLGHWNDYLVLASQVELIYLITCAEQDNDDVVFHAFGEHCHGQKHMHHGSAREVLAMLNESYGISFMLYVEKCRQ